MGPMMGTVLLWKRLHRNGPLALPEAIRAHCLLVRPEPFVVVVGPDWATTARELYQPLMSHQIVHGAEYGLRLHPGGQTATLYGIPISFVPWSQTQRRLGAACPDIVYIVDSGNVPVDVEQVIATRARRRTYEIVPSSTLPLKLLTPKTAAARWKELEGKPWPDKSLAVDSPTGPLEKPPTPSD